MPKNPAQEEPIPPDLLELSGRYPYWWFGAGWIPAATGPDVRYVWAKHRDWKFQGYDAEELSIKLSEWSLG
jgi:hypothetical protein